MYPCERRFSLRRNRERAQMAALYRIKSLRTARTPSEHREIDNHPPEGKLYPKPKQQRPPILTAKQVESTHPRLVLHCILYSYTSSPPSDPGYMPPTGVGQIVGVSSVPKQGMPCVGTSGKSHDTVALPARALLATSPTGMPGGCCDG